MGRLHGVLCRFKEAKEWMDRAVGLAPVTARPIVALKAGFLARDLYDSSIAEHFYRQARKGDQVKVATLALAEHLGRVRRREEAIELLDQVLESDVNNPEAIFLKARFGGYRPSEAETLLVDLVAGPNPELRARGGYELGNLRDKHGDFEGAMGAFVSAKKELATQAKPLIKYRRLTRERFDEMFSGLCNDSVKSWRCERFGGLSGYSGIALIAGHPRSGTTLLEQIVDSHSATVSAEETENFSLFAFGPLLRKRFAETTTFQALDELNPEKIRQGRDKYVRSISKVVGDQKGSPLLVDKNPSLSHLMGAFIRIFPEAKGISMVRDPRDVVLSCYMQPFVPLNPVTACYTTLAECASEYADVMKVHTKTTDVFSEIVLEVRYEDLVRHVESRARQVISFLGLQWEERVLKFYEQAREKIVRSPTSEAVTEDVHQRAVHRWKNYEEFFGSSLDVLEPFLERWNY